MREKKEYTFLGVYIWGAILGNESEFVGKKKKENAKKLQRFKFTGKGSLNSWNAYFVKYFKN